MLKPVKLCFNALLVIISLVACNSNKRLNKSIVYFQRGLDSLGQVEYKEPVIQPGDLLSIQVFSSNLSQEQAAVFNLGNTTNSSVTAQNNPSMQTAGSLPGAGYLVSLDGFIDMPILGRIAAAGLNKQQLSKTIADKLVNYVKQPIVLIKFSSFKISVLGEVNRPGPIIFTNDRANIIDAIAQAGDLKDDARRDNILLIREENGKRISRTIDIRSGAVFQSPFFQLQQNDIIYAVPRDVKLRTLNSDPNAQRNTSILFASISALAIVLQVAILLIRK